MPKYRSVDQPRRKGTEFEFNRIEQAALHVLKENQARMRADFPSQGSTKIAIGLDGLSEDKRTELLMAVDLLMIRQHHLDFQHAGNPQSSIDLKSSTSTGPLYRSNQNNEITIGDSDAKFHLQNLALFLADNGIAFTNSSRLIESARSA